ncbi:RHS repeat-associated core domain-containing protein [Janthinobacterium sp. GW460P]|uniref:RHS repeat-associated core domain-containing protein n=1 Tax=unclassified Janthinobacterium TaxID=2610881 RepID=UPI0014826D7F|nr:MULTISPECIES: RHS repeat-associated core domain-containing protein [unclassified Janthinobacterium]MCC7705613.1 RHS repeat-associated core domain-containing protein [Janthinobacterium sp. GW460P]MCC7711115.1 RHS repeat-associated core domain-containing protein [Janthinobacterium sp. GW460W]
MAISDATGALRERLAYDSWGKRRNLGGDATPDSLDGVTDNRGFTGHEMLDRLDLVHMNGRVYDLQVARFMSADPIIQDPEHSQSYNRYTYVWNNPTNLMDPTGFSALGNIGSWVSGITAQLCGEKVNCRMQNGVPTVTNSGQESTGSNSTETSGGNGAKTPKVSSAITTPTVTDSASAPTGLMRSSRTTVGCHLGTQFQRNLHLLGTTIRS